MWNFLSGYVMIQAEGKNLERFLNLMLENRLEIDHVSRCGISALRFNIITFDFYRLKSLIKKNRLHIKIKILEKHGLFVHLLVFRQRKVLLFGWILVIVLLLFASQRVWFINITGCDKLTEQEVVLILEENGIVCGKRKSGFETAELGKYIMNEDDRIAWAGVNISGVVLEVDICEAQTITIPDEGSEYASIYANSSGKIKRITALMGKPCVKVGDIVQAGDLLINGDLSSEIAPNIFVHARGEVIADVVHTFSASASKMQKKLARTGNYTDVLKVGLFSKTFCDDKTGYEHFEDEYKSKFLFENSVLPLKAEVHRRYELKEKLQEADTMTLAETAKLQAQSLMEKELDKNAVILSKETSVTTLDDGSVRADIVVITEENIAKTREF